MTSRTTRVAWGDFSVTHDPHADSTLSLLLRPASAALRCRGRFPSEVEAGRL
ncbi:hypothetical protein HNR23_002947 [Nocardiopsis mwathae]|uniref:Uncharacterized protein n=1 Tax=Nocardiopsis mwathae TaxID=1472723 RepID=A0A7W9YIQ7_9ACTN|nr:hypothetical protein [Nocardiopsis mwathae]